METTSLSILILNENADDCTSCAEVLREGFANATLTACSDISHFRECLLAKSQHIVVLFHDSNTEEIIQLLHELKLRDIDPVIIAVTNSGVASNVAAFYNHGCDKVFVRHDHWQSELNPSLRHLLRLQKLEDENERLLAKLTEANVLLEEKNKRLDDFSATLAHDIRGPLGGVSMKLEYIVDKYDLELNDRCKQLLSRALQSTDRLTGIVQSMYDLARLGAKSAEMSEVDLNTLVADVVNDLSFDEKLDISIGIDELPKVYGNPQLLQRVFINLVNNAVKYNDKKEILINIGVKGLRERSIARFADIYVQDNGQGIPANEIKDIFTMFSRGSTANNGADGTGIGLAVVQRIAEIHYGSVRIESEVGKGSTFIVSLPLEKIGFLERNLTSEPTSETQTKVNP